MSKKTEPKETKEYFAFNLCPRNLFEFEVIKVENGKIVDVQKEEPTYLPIALDKIRRRLTIMFTGKIYD